MAKVSYDRETLQRAGRKFAKYANSALPRCESPSGELRVTHQFDLDHYINGLRGHNEDLRDPGYVADMCRLSKQNPDNQFCREVPQVSRNGRVVFTMGGAGLPSSGAGAPPSPAGGRRGKLTRFGRVTFHKVYA